MADKPIIFSAPMIRAMLDGRKTQTRRVLKPPYGTLEYLRNGTWRPICTKFFKGDRLYVREAHALVPASAYRMSEGVQQVIDPTDRDRACIYAEGWERCKPRWRPSIHMPRWASRLTLIVTDVRVQRLQEISATDSIAEGVQCATCDAMSASACNGRGCFASVDAFKALWNSINGPDAWDANPWVCALTFTVNHRNINRMEAGA